MPDKTRRVVQTTGFKRDFERLKTEVSRLEDFVIGAEEILCRKPDIGRRTAHDYILALPMTEVPGNPQVSLYYGYNDNEVIFFVLAKEGDPRPSALVM